MSSGVFLFLDLTGKSASDPDRLRAFLRHLPGVRNWDESNPVYAFFFEFAYDGDRTIVQMRANDLRGIAIQGTGDASLQIALEIRVFSRIRG